jgi:hypothetical protein
MNASAMTCDQALDALQDALDAGGAGRPPEEEALPEAVRGHLEACPGCREAWSELSAIESALFEPAFEPFAEPPASLRPRILAALAAEPAFAPGSAPSRGKPLALLAVAGLIAAVGAAASLLSPAQAPTAPDPSREALLAEPFPDASPQQPSPGPAPGFGELEPEGANPLGDWPLVALEALRREGPRLASASLPSSPLLKAPALALPEIDFALPADRLDRAVRAKGAELAASALGALGVDSRSLALLKAAPSMLASPLPLPSFDLEAPASRLAQAAQAEASAFAGSVFGRASEAALSLAPGLPFAD